MKICVKCKLEKEEEDFFKRKNGNCQSYCKSCKREIDKNNYSNSQKRKNYLKKNNDISKDRNKKYIDEILKSSKCANCGDNRIYVLDFHHNNFKEKEYTVSKLRGSGYSIETIKTEIAKCTILCSNCHRELHYLQKLRVFAEGSESHL